MRSLIYSFAGAVGVSWFVPTVAVAQQGSIASVYGDAFSNQMAQGLVTCTGLNCDFCALAALVNGVINWLFGFLVLVAVLIIVAAGFKLVTANGNTEAVTWAKERFVSVVIGLLLMLASWLIIDTILRGLTGQGMSVWGTFEVSECGSMTPATSRTYDEYSPGYTEAPGESGFSAGSQPAALTSTDLASYGGKQFNRGVVANVQDLAERFDLRVTSGYRSPAHNARIGGSPTSWHLTGRAADFVGNETDMQAAAAYAQQTGAVEVLIHNAGSGRHLHVAW